MHLVYHPPDHHGMFILDLNDKDQTTCLVASSIRSADDTDLQHVWQQVFVQEVW